MHEIRITRAPKEKVLEEIEKYLKNGTKNSKQKTKNAVKPWVIVTPNPEQFVLATKDPHFAKILNQADIAIPDGIGIIWGMKILGLSPVPRRLTGVELMESLCEMSGKRAVEIGLIGGREGVAVAALECLKKKYGLTGWAEEPPQMEITNYDVRFKNYESELANTHKSYVINPKSRENDYVTDLTRRIRERHIKIVFVGLGAPKQEYLMEYLASETYDAPIVFMAVGGAFDEISGRVTKPPYSIDKLGLKWFWRLVLEPWRWKRQLALLEYIGMILKKKFSSI